MWKFKGKLLVCDLSMLICRIILRLVILTTDMTPALSDLAIASFILGAP